MLTLKHFIDRPSWAAVAGYNFNFFDCLCFSAQKYDNFFHALYSVFKNLLDTEIREIPGAVVVISLALLGIVLWPFAFFFDAAYVYVKCKRTKKKYPDRESMPDIVKENIRNWLEQCDRLGY